MIKAIAVKNLRGISRSMAINNRLTLFTGPNGAGKSTMLDGIHFALKGTLPGQSAKDGEMWSACATGDEMTTGVSFDAGGSISRSLVKGAKGVTSHQGVINGSGPVLKKAALNALADQNLPCSVVSLVNFWCLSEAKQIAYLARFYDGAEYSILNIKVKFKAEFLPKGDPGTQFDLLASIQDIVKSKKAAHTATIAGSENTIKSLSEQKDGINRPAGTLHDIEAEIASLKTTASQIRANLETFGKNKAKKEAWEQEEKTSREMVDELKKEAVTLQGEPLKTSKIYEWEMNAAEIRRLRPCKMLIKHLSTSPRRSCQAWKQLGAMSAR